MTNENEIDEIIGNIQARDRKQNKTTFFIFGLIMIGLSGAITSVFLYLNKQIHEQQAWRKNIESEQQAWQTSQDLNYAQTQKEIEQKFNDLEKNVSSRNEKLIAVYEKKLTELSKQLENAIRSYIQKADTKHTNRLIIVLRNVYSLRREIHNMNKRLGIAEGNKNTTRTTLSQIQKHQKDIEKKIDQLSSQLQADKASNATIISGLRSKVNKLKSDASKLTQKVNQLTARTPAQPSQP